MKSPKRLEILGRRIRGWLPRWLPRAVFHHSYYEARWMPWWYFLIFAVPVVVLTVMIAVQLVSRAPFGNDPAPTALLMVLDVVFVLITPAFARFTVGIDPIQVTLRFGLVAKKIPIKEVIGATVEDARAGNYGGIGIRYGADGTVAYIRNFGPAVKLTRKEGRPLLFSTRSALEVSRLINSYLRSGTL